jgi:hypothetical protein
MRLHLSGYIPKYLTKQLSRHVLPATMLIIMGCYRPTYPDEVQLTVMRSR